MCGTMAHAEPPRDALHRCAAISLRRHEPLAGTAPRVDHWLLLSYSGPLGQHALADSDLPVGVKEHLQAAVATIPNARLQLIKSRARSQPAGVTCFLVNARPIDPFYNRLQLARYEDLLGFEAHRLLPVEDTPGRGAERAPFYLVCTNGRRDPCCAQYGMPVFEALRSLDAEHVWRCSHVGGHRFAANVIAFPHGIYYGRMRPRLAESLLHAGEQGELLPDHYRGRGCYDSIAQAGEAALRRETGQMGLEAFRLEEVTPLGDDEWRMRFSEAAGAVKYALIARATASGDEEFVSCRSDKQRRVTRYDVQLESVGVSS